MKLDHQAIIREALALLDEHGIDALNMRSVAARLGVQASALYWHVGGREQLLGLMAHSFYEQALTAAVDSASWRQWLMDFGCEFRQALLRHRDSAHLCAIARPVTGDVRRASEVIAAPLLRAGLPLAVAISYQSSVISLALGWAVYEQSTALHAYLAQMLSFEQSFNTGIKALVGGFPAATRHASPHGVKKRIPTRLRDGSRLKPRS